MSGAVLFSLYTPSRRGLGKTCLNYYSSVLNTYTCFCFPYNSFLRATFEARVESSWTLQRVALLNSPRRFEVFAFIVRRRFYESLKGRVCFTG